MARSCQVLALVCLTSCGAARASGLPAHAREVRELPPHWEPQVPDSEKVVLAPNPYAPTRSAPGAYFWQSRRQPELPAVDTWGTGSDPHLLEPALVVASLRPRLRGCFSDWLERQADAEGAVRFAVELGSSGAVQTISATVDAVDPRTVECLFTVLGPARFEPPLGGRATLHIPVVFKNSAL